ncbi:unnamed protein product [Prunus armeniaca]
MDDNDLGNIGFDPYEFANVIGDGDQPLYPSSKLLILQGDLLPEGNTLPSSMKDYEDSTNCHTCGVSRWKEGKDSILKEGVPAKVVWYFPPIPRFKRMFQSHKTAKSLTWHAARKSVDGQISHPADSPSWKLVDDKWLEFGKEPRNLRLALSSDEFNPHITYNLPPWQCMKRKFMMLTLLISGPKQPGIDIDVYLEPFIDDLKSMWDGIRGVYDAHIGKYFTLRGYKVCPICGDDTPSHRGNVQLLMGEEVLHIVEDINYIWGSKNGGSVSENDGDRVCWKKKSKFFALEYWKYLYVRHVLDVMHIEKNICDSTIGTLLEIPGKNKYGIVAQLDLLNMGVKTDLQPEYGQRHTRLPPGPWNLSRAEKRAVFNSFYGMKVPKVYCSNIKNLKSLKDSRLLGLKSHYCHTLMQQLLTVAIRSVLEKPARYAITRLCFFFNAICAKTVDVFKLDKLEEDVVVTLCLLEKYFPPSFFDIMVHNRTHPEGCIAERYIAKETVEFCTEHLSEVNTVGVPSSQKMGVSKPLSGCIVSLVDRDLLNQAHLYVLENTKEVLPYIKYV